MGFSSGKIRAISGIDGFQAMQLAMDSIGVDLEVLQGNSHGCLVWDASDNGDLGFRVFRAGRKNKVDGNGANRN
jgi:hypothetical protein